jgi:hypothetical protein
MADGGVWGAVHDSNFTPHLSLATSTSFHLPFIFKHMPPCALLNGLPLLESQQRYLQMPLNAGSEVCAQCNTISDVMQRWQYEPNNSLTIDLGTFGDLESRVKCITCQAVAQYFIAENNLDDENDLSSACKLQFKRASSSQRFKILLVRTKRY